MLSLSHPHIVQYYGAGREEARRPFLVLELLGGGSLYSILSVPARLAKGRPFPPERVLEIGRSLAAALNYLHTDFHPDAVIIHRDLKPDNIGFTDSGVVKLMDFGLCICVRRRSDPFETYSMTGTAPHSPHTTFLATAPFITNNVCFPSECAGRTGSLRYMAPEVIRELPYTESVDIYSYGLIMWHVATGIAPFADLTRSDFYTKVVTLEQRPPTTPDTTLLPEAFGNILSDCWHPSPRKRMSAAQLLGAWDELGRERRVEARSWVGWFRSYPKLL